MLSEELDEVLNDKRIAHMSERGFVKPHLDFPKSKKKGKGCSFKLRLSKDLPANEIEGLLLVCWGSSVKGVQARLLTSASKPPTTANLLQIFQRIAQEVWMTTIPALPKSPLPKEKYKVFNYSYSFIA